MSFIVPLVALVMNGQLGPDFPLGQLPQWKSACINEAVKTTSTTAYASSPRYLLGLVGAAATSALRCAVSIAMATIAAAVE